MSTRAGFVASLALSAALAGSGCAGASPTLDRWLGRTPAPPAASGHGNVYYSAVDGLKVYSGPSRSAALVGALPLHARVVRAKLEGGYAYVKTDPSGPEGWVDNAQLLWRLPDEAAVPPVAEEQEPPRSEAPEPAAPASPPVEQPAKPPAERTQPTPSVFDPY